MRYNYFIGRGCPPMPLIWVPYARITFKRPEGSMDDLPIMSVKDTGIRYAEEREYSPDCPIDSVEAHREHKGLI